MGDADEGAGGGGAPGDVDAGLLGCGRVEIEWKARGNDVPQLADLGLGGVKLGADDGGEVVGAQAAGVGDRPVIDAEKVVGQHHEVVARVLVGFDHLVGASTPSDKVEWVWRLPRQNRPGSEKGERSGMENSEGPRWLADSRTGLKGGLSPDAKAGRFCNLQK